MTDAVSYPGKPGCDRDGRPLQRGDLVRCARPEGRPLGTWPRYEGRIARVLVVDNHGETGVVWSAGPDDHTTSWFVAAELERL